MIRLNVFIQVNESNRNAVLENSKGIGSTIFKRQRLYRL